MKAQNPIRMTPAQQIDKEAQRIAEIARKSNDLGVQAKAIAIRNRKVRTLLVKKLSAGQTLMRVSVLPGPNDDTRRLFFELQDPTHSVRLIQEGFLVVVDMKRSRLLCVNDPYYPNEQDAYALPFALNIPSGAEEVTIPISKTEEGQRKAMEFFRSLQLDYDPCVVQSTTCSVSTVFGCISYSGTPTAADDTKSDYATERVTDD